MSESKFKYVTFRLTLDEHKKLKILAAELGITLKALLLRCVDRLREEQDQKKQKGDL